MSEPVIFAIVDAPGKPIDRGTVAILATKKRIGEDQLEVPEQYDELVPNSQGLFILDTDHPNHGRRVAVLERKKKARRGGAEIIGPFDNIPAALVAKYEARPKSAEEMLAVERSERVKLATENSALEAKLAKLQSKKSNKPALEE
jgi:hypothetical protein